MKQKRVGLSPDQLDDQRRRTEFGVFELKVGDALHRVGLDDGCKPGAARIFAQQQQQRRFGLDAAAQLVRHRLDARLPRRQRQQQLMAGAGRVDFASQRVRIDQQHLLNAPRTKLCGKLSDDASQRQGVKVHGGQASGWGSSACCRQARAITGSRCAIVPPAVKYAPMLSNQSRLRLIAV